MNEEKRKEIEEKIAYGLSVIDRAVKQYNPIAVVGMMSGGDDSLPACYIASLHHAFSGMLHINTGIGIEQTREHVRRLCADRKWKLWEYKAEENTKADGSPDPMIYRDLCLMNGFPGPFQHGKMYSKLKERQIARFLRDVRSDRGVGKILLVNGARSKESMRRKRNVVKEIDRRGGSVWVNVILGWDREDCGWARIYAELPRNPVAEHLGMSGECLCGAFAKPGELDRIGFWYPDFKRKILALQDEVKAAGMPWGWEDPGPQEWYTRAMGGQCFLDMDMETPAHLQYLCTSCNKRENALRDNL